MPCKWRRWMWLIAADRRTRSPSRLARFEGRLPPDAESCDSTINIVIAIGFIIIIITLH